jgi:ATP-dependent helicase/nuclease subunit B
MPHYRHRVQRTKHKMTDTAHHIYSIPAGIPFAESFARGIMNDALGYGLSTAELGSIRILLPTRRGGRVLRENFLKLSEGKPLILPTITTIGDIEEEELSLSALPLSQSILDLPPAIAPLRRQILLAKTIQKLDQQTNTAQRRFDQHMSLAKLLGQFMDQIYTEELNFSALQNLVPEEFADHWNITLDFLGILSEHWPQILAEEGVIDVAQRRVRLIRALQTHWQEAPPQTPVIAAGTTGSIPAVADLLGTIATCPKGAVILPGFDFNSENDDWNTLTETHPQYGFKHLLERLGQERTSVKLWPDTQEKQIVTRHILTKEITRPEQTSSKWINFSQNDDARNSILSTLQNLQYFECDSTHDEATLISLMARETLESDDKTLAVITPDRTLARRISTQCLKWGIIVDDTAGYSILHSLPATFMMSTITSICNSHSPVSLLTMLKHKLCSFSTNDVIHFLDHRVVRGQKPSAGFDGIKKRLYDLTKPSASGYIAISEDDALYQDTLSFLDNLQPIFSIVDSDLNNKKPFKVLLLNHIKICETLSGYPDTPALWMGETGENLSLALSHLIDHAGSIPDVTVHEYAVLLKTYLKEQTIRPNQGVHPRIHIMGQLEARMIQADKIVLAGLNEGTWPADSAQDPWMSRPMRKDFGLPSPERSIGLAAHDFIQGLSHRNVVLTRSKTQDNTPTVPARWLQRMDTVLQSCGTSLSALSDGPYLSWVKDLHSADTTTSARRPAPKPPLHKRPRSLSVTAIETWLKDPYSIFARYVLNLKKLDPLEAQSQAAERGQFIHALFDQFVREHPKTMPENATTILYDMAQELFPDYFQDTQNQLTFWPRIERLISWFVETETHWRNDATPFLTESQGETMLNAAHAPFRLKARADRIDRMRDGSFSILDYKTGSGLTKSGIINGQNPQLILEGLILQKQGFEWSEPSDLSALSYWIVTGGKEKGKIITESSKNLVDHVACAEQSLIRLIDVFDDEETPYYSLPNMKNTPRFNDYEHLARASEWADSEDGGDSVAGGDL